MPDPRTGMRTFRYLVTADDLSFVRMFNYPVVWDDAPHKVFRGHASHVMWIRFACDDRICVSAGGHDRGIYQWRTLGMNKEDMEGADAKDKLIMVCMEELIQQRRDTNTVTQPKPGVGWGALDDEGKIFGPLATLTKSVPPSPAGKSLPSSCNMSKSRPPSFSTPK